MVGWGGVVVAHKILVLAPVPLELILAGFDWVGTGPWGLGFGTGLDNSICGRFYIIRSLSYKIETLNL